MVKRKIGIRVLPPDPGCGKRTPYTDGSLLYIPLSDKHEIDICLQAVEIVPDGEGNETYYPVSLDECRIGVRTFKTKRRMLHVKRDRKE